MRPVPLLSAVSLVAFFSACNAILGNESDYELVSGGAGDDSRAGTGGTAGAGKGGSGGGTSGSGGKATIGKGGLGGSSNTGGKGGTGTATGGGSGEGGTQETAGEGGAAGGGSSCEPTGPEDCFNGEDDDCNDAVDCKDAACDGPAECHPAVDGAELGYFVYPDESCAEGFTLVEMGKDLQAGQCSGCSCSSPTSMLCDSSVIGLQAGTSCPGFAQDGNAQNMYNDRCGSMPPNPNLHFWTIRGTAQCTPQGTPTLDPPLWTEQMNFCRLGLVGGGCGSGQACLPTGTGNLCALTDDERGCDGDFPNDHGTWHEGFLDERTCGECQCGLGTASCAGAYIAAYTAGGCSGAATQLGDGSGNQGDICGLAAPFQTGRIIGTPTNGSCQATAYIASGEATPIGPHKACCQN
jgi:hypothetical protein